MISSYQETLKKDFFFSLKPAYLLTGPEEKLIEEVKTGILNACLPAEFYDLNLTSWDFSDDPPPALDISLLNTPPFLGERRVVLIKHLELMDSKGLEALSLYLKNPNPTTCLVAAVSPQQKKKKQKETAQEEGKKRKDKWKKVEEHFKKAGAVVNCSMGFGYAKDSMLREWMNRQAKKHGKKLEPGAESLLVTVTSGNLSFLDKEIEKLSCYAGEESAITLESVEQVSVPQIEAAIFSLTDAAGEKNLQAALEALIPFARSRGEMAVALSMLARHFRLVWQAKAAVELGILSGNPAAVEKELQQIDEEKKSQFPEKENLLSQKPFPLQKFVKHARNFARTELSSILRRIYETDLSIKAIQNPMDQKLALEMLLIHICMRETSRKVS